MIKNFNIPSNIFDGSDKLIVKRVNLENELKLLNVGRDWLKNLREIDYEGEMYNFDTYKEKIANYTDIKIDMDSKKKYYKSYENVIDNPIIDNMDRIKLYDAKEYCRYLSFITTIPVEKRDNKYINGRIVIYESGGDNTYLKKFMGEQNFKKMLNDLEESKKVIEKFDKKHTNQNAPYKALETFIGKHFSNEELEELKIHTEKVINYLKIVKNIYLKYNDDYLKNIEKDIKNKQELFKKVLIDETLKNINNDKYKLESICKNKCEIYLYFLYNGSLEKINVDIGAKSITNKTNIDGVIVSGKPFNSIEELISDAYIEGILKDISTNPVKNK